MTKYKIGDEFESKNFATLVKTTILFVPPIDGYGKQYYLEEVHSKLANGGGKMFLSLSEEENIDRNFRQVKK